MWKSAIKTLSYLFGPTYTMNMCDHGEYKVKDVYLDKGDLLQSCTLEKSEPYRIYLFRGTAVCDTCGLEFSTWANTQIKDKSGPDDITNYDKYDNWRDYNNFLPGAKKREIISMKEIGKE
jgi:hypothetical protein